jgi:anaerobic selenocysteine-containing dehydrogenase
VAGRTLYDRSRIVVETPVLARLTPAAGVLRVNPNDAGRIGAARGSEVRITAARGSLVVVLEPDAAVPAGTARFDFTADGQGPALLIDAASPVTDVRVESIR